MLNPRLATRYAKAIIDLAIEKQELDTVYKDMLYLQQLTRGSKELVSLLKSPVIPSDKKRKAMESILGKDVSEMTSAFIRLLITKGRESDLPEVATAFITQYKQKKGIHTVKLTTATNISEQTKNMLVDQVRKTSDMQNIELETIVDPSIIGGFVLQAGDKLVDASISYDLKTIAKQFDNNDFIYKVR
jgi:F-type H+-transporting ATPase subunit delta